MSQHFRPEHLEERQLPHAVILVAIDDLGLLPSFGPPRGIRTATPLKWHQRKDERDRAINRREALLFLTAASGPWAEARETWCGMTDIDPDLLREKVLKLLAARRAERLARVRVRTRSRPVLRHDQPTQPTHASSASLPSATASATTTTL
jgi:hypothetical protein